MARKSAPKSRRKPRPDKLTPYREKRNFARTSEPAVGGASGGSLFVVHKHSATRLHYDLRLEMGGVLKSWAVTKGPSLDPKVKRLAVHVEDHPLAYGDFEGTIPKGQYGGGPIIIWDHGTWVPVGDVEAAYEKGELKFRLDGEKLHGGWALVRLKGERNRDGKNWLLIKERDTFVRPDDEGAITDTDPLSVVSGLSVEDLAEEAERQSVRTGHKKARRKKVSAARLKGAFKEPLPDVPRPQLATLAKSPPDGADWLHEIKFDGYRTLCRLEDGTAALFTRNGHDWTDRYRPIAEAFETLNCRDAIIDGEICVQDVTGATSFSELRDALSEGTAERLTFFAFDLLHINRYSLAKVPLTKRKELLHDLLDPIIGPASAVQYSDHIEGGGPAFFDEASRLGLEGIVSKKKTSTYIPGRSQGWLKTKCVNTEEFTIVGYTESKAAGGLSALLLAEPQADGLRSVGKVGTGFSAKEAARLLEEFRALRRGDPVFTLKHNYKKSAATWVEPKLIAEVQYQSRTKEGKLRGAAYKGLRFDLAGGTGAPKGHVADADLADIWVTNPDRRMFGKEGPTKLDLVLYYAQVGAWMLPDLARRPLTLVRCPTGDLEDAFYQRHLSDGMPAEIKPIALREEGSKKRADFLYIEDAKGLLWLSQFGVIEFHPWGCRVDKPERPDRMVLDLDPDESLAWREVVEGAFEVRDALADLGLTSFVRTTGGKGLHVVVPLERRTTWSAMKDVSHAFVRRLAEAAPKRYTASPSKRDRRGRIFIDYLRNGRGATAVASYSLRARPGAPAATPLGWRELADIEDPLDLNYSSVPQRLAGLHTDPWADVAESPQRITKEVERKLGINK